MNDELELKIVMPIGHVPILYKDRTRYKHYYRNDEGAWVQADSSVISGVVFDVSLMLGAVK